MSDDDEVDSPALAFQSAARMAKRLAEEIRRQRDAYAQQQVEDEALIGFCELTSAQISVLRDAPITDEERSLQIAGRAAALLMMGEVPWLAEDGDIQSAVMPDDEVGAERSNIALAVAGIVAEELIANTPLALAAVHGRAHLPALAECNPAGDTPDALFDRFRRYYAEQFLPHIPAITALAEEMQRDRMTAQALADFGRRWNLLPRPQAAAA